MQEAAPHTKEPEHSHFLTRPMFEIFLVSIHPNKINDDGNPCQIHGLVQVVDEVGKRFDFYNRTMTDLETVVFGGFLSLCAFPIMPSKLLKVVVNLYDAKQDVEIANGCFEIDYSKMYEYDKVHTEHVQGKYGHASVCYASFQHALIASVEKVILHHETVGSSIGANLLFGTVAARLERKFRKAGGNIDNEFPPVTLFQNQRKAEESTSDLAELNTPIKLFRSCVVVPFNYTLRIEAEFHDKTDTKIVMAIQLNAYPQSLNKESVQNQDCEMHVKVTWLDCYDHFPRQVKVKDNPVAGEGESQLSSEALREIEKKDNTNVEKESAGAITSKPKSQLSSEDEKYLKLCAEVCRVLMEEDTTKLLSETQRSPSSICGRQPCCAIPILSSCVEVYSVLICVEEKDLDVCGTIEMEDSGRSPFYIFDGHERLGDQKTLSILGPLRSFNDRPFTMRVDLKDGKERIISKGSFCWNGSDDSSISYYERHLCSVIPGDIGYATIQYSMFSYGKQVRIRMVFSTQRRRCDFVNVYGTITATYGNHEYSTLYEQDYYKVTLFSKLKHESVRVKLSEVLPLLKPVVSVPFENSLMLDVNLKIIGTLERNKQVGDDTSRTEHIQEQLKINGKVDSRIGVGREGLYMFLLSTDVCNVKQCGLSTFQKQCKKTQRFIEGVSSFKFFG